MPQYLEYLVEVSPQETHDFVGIQDEINPETGTYKVYYRCNDLGQFWMKYCRRNAAGKTSYLSEPLNEYGPFAFKFYVKSEGYKFTDIVPFTQEVTIALQDVFEDLIIMGQSREQLLVVILEAGEIGVDEVALRFQAPYVNVNQEGREVLFNRFLSVVQERKLLEKLSNELHQDPDELFNLYYDEMPLLGSVGLEEHSMTFSAIYHRDGDLTRPTITRDMMMLHLFHKGANLADFDVDEDPEFPLPLFLSVNFTPERAKFVHHKVKISTEDSPVDMAKHFLGLLDVNRYRTETIALTIGKALHTVCHERAEGAAIWLAELRKAHRQEPLPYIKTTLEDYVKDNYEVFNRHNITIKTLGYYARKDNLNAYKQWHRAWVNSALEKIVEISEFSPPGKGVFKIPHTRTAKAIYRYYWLYYVCTDVSKKQWYKFDGVRWVPDDSGISLSTSISEDFRQAVIEMTAKLAAERMKSKDKSFQSTATIMINRYEGLAEALEDVSFKSKIMRELAGHFYNPNFFNILDTNYAVLGTMDQVMEIFGTELYMREGKPEDYISKSVPIKLDPNYSWGHKRVKTLMRWLKQVFFKKGLLEYFLKYCASFLYGRNLERNFSNMTGIGSNGKSMIIQLFECTFGTYCIKIPVAALTGKRTGSSNASPEFARIEGARLIIIDEPDETEKMNKAMLKLLASNGDSIFARFLNQNGKDIRMNAHPILVCNDPPDCPNADRATRNRWVTIPCLALYSLEAPTDENEQERLHHYKIDLDFPDTIPFLAPAFFWVITQYWSKYKIEGLEKPKIVVKYTQDYWNKHDTYLKYINKRITVALDEEGQPDQNQRLSVDELHTDFARWFRKTYGTRTEPPEPTVFENRISEHMGPPRDEFWYGIELKEITHSQTGPGGRKTNGLKRPRSG